MSQSDTSRDTRPRTEGSPPSLTPLSPLPDNPHPVAIIAKTALDFLIVVPALVCLIPLLLLISLLIRLDSPGPVIYRRQVLGRQGQPFAAFKFRTMVVNGDAILAQYPRLRTELEEAHKLKEDPRITRVGYFLRKFSLDELPQLINILRRDMSLVGPRIITPAELEKYGCWGDTLLTVPPGLTGLWQISGRSNVSYEERVDLDLTYVHNWSVWLDLRIVFLTLPAVLRADGAY